MSKQKNVQRQTRQTQVEAYAAEFHYSGPLPHPRDLEKYNEIIPDGANRIMVMAEKQQEHRFKLEEKAVSAQVKQSGIGQVFGLVVCLVGLGISALLGLYGHELASGILGGGGLVGLASVFVVGKNRQRKSLSKKDP